MGGTGLFSSVVEHWSRKPGVVSSILTGGIFVVAVYLFLVCLISLKKRKEKKKLFRSRQDSNLRGETPFDFESNALTTRPRLHFIYIVDSYSEHQESIIQTTYIAPLV